MGLPCTFSSFFISAGNPCHVVNATARRLSLSQGILCWVCHPSTDTLPYTCLRMLKYICFRQLAPLLSEVQAWCQTTANFKHTTKKAKETAEIKQQSVKIHNFARLLSLCIVLLRHCNVLLGDWNPTFRDCVVVPFLKDFGHLTNTNKTTILNRQVGY